MTLDLGELVGFLEIDPTRWNKGIDDALRSVDEFGNKAKPRAQAAGQKAGQAFGDGMVPEAAQAGEDAAEEAGDGLMSKGVVAAGAAGVAFGMAFGEALDIDAGRDKLAAQLGATVRDSRRYGRIASTLYSGAWGESMDQVNTAIASVVTSIDGMDNTSGRRLQRLTARALDFATAFEVDVVRATQVAGVMIEANLAKGGVDAFDLLTKASQQVPVALREDLLDATEEYGQFFGSLGYSGQEAFALLVDASEKGMYGIDKAGDAVKEFTIRSTDMSALSVSAYELIGLSAEDMATKILKGGDDARQATTKVIDGLLGIEDPATRANAAIALFGTPIEDLNVRDIPAFLRSLKGTSDRMDDVAGASKRMGDTLNDNAGTRIESFKRTMKTKLVDFLADEVIPLVEDDVLPAVERFGDWFTKDGGPALQEFHDDLKPVLGTVKDLVGWLEDLPKPAKYAGLVALLGGIGAMKLRGNGGGLGGSIGSALGLAKPVPVFVTNPGFGGGTPGGAVTKGGALRTLGGVAAGVTGYVALNEALHATGMPDRIIWTPFGPIDKKQYEDAAGWFQSEQLEAKGTLVKGIDTLVAKVDGFADSLDLVGAKKIDPSLTVPGLRDAHRDLQKFLALEIEAGRPITPYVTLTGVQAAQQQIAGLIADIHAIPSIGSHDAPFVSGAGTSSQPGGKKGGGDVSGTNQKAGVNFNGPMYIQAQDYRDMQRQLQQRTQQAAIGGFGH